MATYNISEERILGDELFVYINTSGTTWEPLAYSTTCSLNLTSDTIDASNKMAGVWTAALPGKLSWTISTEALMSTDFTQNESKTYYEGEAYCSSCNLTADNGAVCTMSVEFTGNGELKQTKA